MNIRLQKINKNKNSKKSIAWKVTTAGWRLLYTIRACVELMLTWSAVNNTHKYIKIKN